ncbi:hypothetical protein QQG55_36405 [Brugia pahangi]
MRYGAQWNIFKDEQCHQTGSVASSFFYSFNIVMATDNLCAGNQSMKYFRENEKCKTRTIIEQPKKFHQRRLENKTSGE